MTNAAAFAEARRTPRTCYHTVLKVAKSVGLHLLCSQSNTGILTDQYATDITSGRKAWASPGGCRRARVAAGAFRVSVEEHGPVGDSQSYECADVIVRDRPYSAGASLNGLAGA